MKSGVNGVASPVFGPARRLIGSLVVLGTFTKESAERYGAEVSAAAGKFSALIGGTLPMNEQQSSFANVLVMDQLRAEEEE